MKKKINKEKSVVFSNWYDTVKLDQKGTFVNDFNKPEDYFEDTLWCIRADEIKPFGDSYSIWYKYFVPEDTMVLEEEYKPFTKMEQLKKEGLYIGNSFWLRSKDDTEITHLVTVTSITLNKGDIAFIGLGARLLSTEELLNNYLWCKSHTDNEWRPFGVKE